MTRTGIDCGASGPFLALFAALASGCASAPTGSATTATAAESAPQPGPSRVERALVAALAADDAEIRRQALAACEWLGRQDHVTAVAEVLGADDPTERANALHTLGLIADHDPIAQPMVAPHLLRGLRDPSPACVTEAIRAFSSAEPGDWREIEAFLASNSWQLRLDALVLLLRRGRAVHRNDVAAALRDFGDTYASRLLAPVLEHVDDPELRPLLAPFVDHYDPRLRHRSQEAILRLDAIAAGAPDPRPPSQLARERYAAANDAAELRIGQLAWRETSTAAVLDAVRGARLVLFAEAHFPEGPLRQAQQQVLRAMAAERPDLLVLGYEPSVEREQRAVLDLAAELGVQTRPLETDWQTLNPARRFAERDDQAAQAINACLAEQPGPRMLVLRGEAHCLPGGYLCRQLAVSPVIVLSVCFPPLRALGDRAQVAGRTFRIGDDGQLFYWGVVEVMQPELLRWIAAQH